MLKKIVFIFALLFTTGLYAQSFEKGSTDLNLGIGFGTPYGSGHYRIFPPVSASLDYGITDDISIGGYIGYTAVSWRYTGRYACKEGPNWVYYDYVDYDRWSHYVFAFRGAFHFGRFIKEDKLDLYAGLALGYDYASYRYRTNVSCRNSIIYSGAEYGGVYFGAYVGCRYRFSDKVGIFSEVGYGLSFLTIGVNFKLK